MQLYGSYTSPYVRRVRIFAAGLGLVPAFTDVATEAGQAALRSVSPLWRVPVVRFDDGTVLWDSQAILEALARRHGWGPFRPVGDPEWESNLVLATNGALESAVNVFYLRRDGVDVDTVPYLRKQQERVDAALAWVEGQLRGTTFVEDRPGFAELVLFTTLEWLAFRKTWEVAAHPRLEAFRARWAGHAGWAASAPPGG